MPNRDNPFIYNKLTLCNKSTADLAVLHIFYSSNAKTAFLSLVSNFAYLKIFVVTGKAIVEDRQFICFEKINFL